MKSSLLIKEQEFNELNSSYQQKIQELINENFNLKEQKILLEKETPLIKSEIDLLKSEIVAKNNEIQALLAKLCSFKY